MGTIDMEIKTGAIEWTRIEKLLIQSYVQYLGDGFTWTANLSSPQYTFGRNLHRYHFHLKPKFGTIFEKNNKK